MVMVVMAKTMVLMWLTRGADIEMICIIDIAAAKMLLILLMMMRTSLLLIWVWMITAAAAVIILIILVIVMLLVVVGALRQVWVAVHASRSRELSRRTADAVHVRRSKILLETWQRRRRGSVHVVAIILEVWILVGISEFVGSVHERVGNASGVVVIIIICIDIRTQKTRSEQMVIHVVAWVAGGETAWIQENVVVAAVAVIADDVDWSGT